ncbi:hypothetical protein CapIbe_000713 [Capra ibex]
MSILRTRNGSLPLLEGCVAQDSGRRVARSREAKSPGPTKRPPRPLRLRSEPADGAPGANFSREEEAPRQVTGYVDSPDEKRLSVRLPAGRTVSPPLCQARAAPAHLRRAGTPPRPPRWPLRHEASALPPRSSGERGGACAAGGRGCSADWSRGPGRTRADRKPPSLPNLIGSVFPFPPITDARAVFDALGLSEPVCQSIAVLGVALRLLGGEGVRETEAPCQFLGFVASVSLADYSGAFLLSATGDSTAELTAFRVKPRLLWELPSGFCT